MLKRLLIPPLVPSALSALALIWMVIDETQGGPRMVDGNPDNAPRNAAIILLCATPVFYLLFGILNLLDLAFDRFRSPVAWLASIGLWAALALVVTNFFYVPAMDSSPFTGMIMASLTAGLLLFPMALLRRTVLSPHRAVSTIRVQDSVPFDTLFTDAGDAPKAKHSE